MLINYVDVSDIGDPVSTNPVYTDTGYSVSTNHVNISDAGDPVFNNNVDILDTGHSVLADDEINVISDDVEFVNVLYDCDPVLTNHVYTSDTGDHVLSRCFRCWRSCIN